MGTASAQQTGKNITFLSEKEWESWLKTTSYSEIQYIILDEKTSIDDIRGKLNTLYQTPYADITYLHIYSPDISESTCNKLILCRVENGTARIIHIILFTCSVSGRHIRVINHCFTISRSDIEIIRQILLDTFTAARKITFPFLFIDTARPAPRTVIFEKQADMILQLPDSIDAYMKSLGSTTRKSLRNSKNRIAKDGLNLKITYIEKENINRTQIASIIELNRHRQESKGKVSLNSERECEALYQYARISGGICLATIDEKIVGGTVMFTFSSHAYSTVTGHDNTFNKYSIGSLVSISEVEFMIEKNIHYLHLLWGEQEYKFRFHAQPFLLHDIILFRNAFPCAISRKLYAVRTLCKTAKKKLAKISIIEHAYAKIRRALHK